jgi:hypothetical protein
MLAKQLDLTLEDPGSLGDILPSKSGQVTTFCLVEPRLRNPS